MIMDQARGGYGSRTKWSYCRCENIGKVFNLDVITMIDVLHEAEKTGAIKIIRTAGLDIIRIEHRYTFEECVDKFYESIERNRSKYGRYDFSGNWIPKFRQYRI